MRATLAVAAAGNLRTTTLRGLGEQEMDAYLRAFHKASMRSYYPWPP